MHPAEVSTQARKMSRIQGWFSCEAAAIFAWIDEIQRRIGVTGDFFEIGCHHGRSTAFLASLVNSPQECLNVCDLFGDQASNVSGSGHGDRHIFERNLAHHTKNGLKLKIVQKISSQLTIEEIGTSYRFFHVDGGHNTDEALFDLQLAAQAIVDHGVIALDDPFRAEWPGVTEAVVRFLDQRKDFRAVCVGFNKLILARTAHVELYASEFSKTDQRTAYGLGFPWHLKTLPFHDAPLQIFYIPVYLTKSPLRRLAGKHLNTPVLGPVLRAAKSLLKRN